MTCVSCQHQWCWLCLGPYDENHYAEGACSGKQFSSEQDPEYEDEDPYRTFIVHDNFAEEDPTIEQLEHIRHHRRWRNIHARIGLCVAGVVAAPVVAPVVVGVVLYGALKYLISKSDDESRRSRHSGIY